MNTQIKTIDPSTIHFYSQDIEDPKFSVSDPNTLSILKEAVELLKQDNVISIPTETVYGLASNALSLNSIKKIYAVKNRPADNPLIVHVSSLKMLRALLPKNNNNFGEIPEIYEQIIKKFWPGPLTILLPKSLLIPSEVTSPSANTSGKPSPTLASHVFTDLNGSHGPVILRPGGITFEALYKMPGMENLRVYKKDFVDKKLEMGPTTPGMKYRHYSPDAEVILVDIDDKHKSRDVMDREIEKIRKNGKLTIGILATGTSYISSKEEYENNKSLSQGIIEYTLGDSMHPEQIAKELFKGLRHLDECNVDCIIVEGIPEEEEGLAVMNRLRKAASRIINE
ncbi:unnamed protein product [Rhizophagus irregularis]|nr:unnamed protein product [Rhizophagus irregularis]CAB5216684.1 unnamed protein product [Rhizophagus irregularis]